MNTIPQVPQVGQIYRHYKGNAYKIIAIHHMATDGNEGDVVAYDAVDQQYSAKATVQKDGYCRRIEDFFATVKYNGMTQTRFMLIDTSTHIVPAKIAEPKTAPIESESKTRQYPHASTEPL